MAEPVAVGVSVVLPGPERFRVSARPRDARMTYGLMEAYMRINQLKQKLAERQVVIGYASTLAVSGVLEAVGPGYDYVWLDAQHGTHTVESVRHGVREAENLGMEAMVRVPGSEYGIIGPFLDTGVGAILIPMVNSAAEAAAIVYATRFPPLGKRSYGGRRVWDVYGVRYYQDWEPLVIVMLETKEGLANAREILMTPGIDGFILGSVDMAVDLGYPPEAWGRPREEQLPDLIQNALNAGKFGGCVCFSVATMQRVVGWGCQFISFGDETAFLTAAARARLAEARTALAIA